MGIYLPTSNDPRVQEFIASNVGAPLDSLQDDFKAALHTAVGPAGDGLAIDDLWKLYITNRYGVWRGPHINNYESEATFQFGLVLPIGAKDALFPYRYVSAPSGGTLEVSGAGVTANYNYPIGDYMVFSVDVATDATPGNRTLTYTAPDTSVHTFTLIVDAKDLVTVTPPVGADECFQWTESAGSGSWQRDAFTFESSTQLDVGTFNYFIDWNAMIVVSVPVTLGANQEFTTAVLNISLVSKVAPQDTRIYAQKLVPGDYPFATFTATGGAKPDTFTLTTASGLLASGTAAPGDYAIDVQPVLQELMQAGYFQAGVARRVNFVIRPAAFTTGSFKVTKSSLSLSYETRERTPGEVEPLRAAIGKIVTMNAFNPEYDAWDERFIRIRNSGNQNSYGTAYWEMNAGKPGVHPAPIAGDPNYFTWTQAINELDNDTYATGTEASKVERMFGTNVRVETAPGSGIYSNGWGMKPATKSYMMVLACRASSTGNTQYLIDTFNTIGYAMELSPNSVAVPADGYVRFSQDFLSDYGLQSLTISPQPGNTLNDPMLIALIWNHATAQITIRAYTATDPAGDFQTVAYTASPGATDGVTGAFGSWVASGSPTSMVGWQLAGGGRYSFCGMIEFDAGLPADLTDALLWMSRYIPQGVKGWYPAWRP